MRKSFLYITIGILFYLSSFFGDAYAKTETKLDTATFAAGCFWCVEAQFQILDGVEKVVPGYTGGKVNTPSYRLVSTGNTGHAEAINIIYNPEIITYGTLLQAFFIAHDPTQLNRQGNDIGTQYRSAIYYHNETEKAQALYYIKRLNAEKVYPKAIVTEVVPYTRFYPAEAEHINYYQRNPEAAYCRYVIAPKMEEFQKIFKEKIKEN